MKNKGFVYVLEFNGFTKVGMSTSVEKRIKGIETQLKEKASNVFFEHTNEPLRVEKDVCDHLYSKRKDNKFFKNEIFGESFKNCVQLVKHYMNSSRVVESSLEAVMNNIKRNEKGMLCLNDVHRASGCEKRHNPSYWLSNKSTNRLLVEMGDCSIESIPGRYGGTYASKGLIYSYAMWIRPKFFLEIVNFYDRGELFNENQSTELSRPELLDLKMRAEELLATLNNVKGLIN